MSQLQQVWTSMNTTIVVSLNAEEAEFVQALVASGRYASVSDAMHQALAEMRAHSDVADHYSADELRGLVEQGLASGESSVASVADLKIEARRRLRAVE